ncbi:MAG: DNA mismatch repair protein MutL [Flavobacteriales bacterium]|nr:DNA mismatch repair protein MutL [Flavobacteriales bacterium]
MDLIQVLSKQIANQIAAGEVIQRPSSAVKELMENSIDSGADKIELYIKDAGKSLIKVVDNGSGMSVNDARNCHKRHYTSKINNINDLFKIKTMGFRGEALASIASISMMEIISKKIENNIGIKIILNDGKIVDESEYVSQNGTTINIKNLFYNVPARRKFLKSNNVELRHITNSFTRIALANPDVEMHFYSDNKRILFLKKSNFRKRIIDIIGSKKNELLVPINETTSLASISGFIGKPEAAKRTRGEQYFFVNGRFIKNNYLNHAIQKGYSDLIGDKYFPSYFINFKIKSDLIDINIHPTKTEIKFENEKEIYAILRATTRKSLGEYNIAPSIDFAQEIAFQDSYSSSKNNYISEPKIKIDKNYNPFNNEFYVNENIQNKQEEIIKFNVNDKNLQPIHFGNKFIIYFANNEINIVHQRRAHKRILYEKILKMKKGSILSQKLLFEQIIEFSIGDVKIIENIKKKLINIGFLIKIKDVNKVEFNSIPNNLKESDIKSTIEDIIELHKQNENENTKINSEIAIALSNKLAIKSSRNLNTLEMNDLIKQLFACENQYTCPSGKKIIKKITNSEIENNF